LKLTLACCCCTGTSCGQPVDPSPQGVVPITNSQKTNKLSPDSVYRAPRTHNDEVNTVQSPVLNNNQVSSKRVYISTPPSHRNKKGIGHKMKKSSLNYKAAHDILSLADRANHFQVYSTAVTSADNIVINKTPLVISSTKEVSTNYQVPHNLSQVVGWV
jgi:hypothetical protein